MSFKTPAIALLTALALTSTVLTPLAVQAKAHAHAKHTPAVFTPQLPDRAKGVDFAQNHSDIKADPAVVFGKLPNGMTYIIMKNATPPGTASMRLRIAGGSLMEHDDQQGLAHFIEHMAFNGSTNVAEGDMVKILERHGLAFGPDTNAFTSMDETVYQLDLPKVGDDDLDTGLFLMRETAGNLLLDDGAIDRERGVILGEERLRDNPGTHDFNHWIAEAFAGQKYPVRQTIGKVDVINSAKHDTFADFYNNYYRPNNATLVVVGDIDPAAIEAKIKAKFSDWTSKVPGDIRATDFGSYQTKGLIADTYTETGLPDGVTVTWNQPLDEHYQTEAKEIADLKDQIRLTILNQRLDRLAKTDGATFAAASVGKYDLEHTASIVQLSIEPKPGQDKAAFAQTYTELKQYTAFGADQDELDRALADLETSFKTALQGSKTRDTRGLADGFAGAIQSGDVITSPEQDYADFKNIKSTLTLDAINAGIKPLFSGDGPILWHSGESTGDLDKQALLDTYNAVESAKLTAAEAHASKPWPYTDFGTPSAIVSKTEVPDLGLTQLVYANGVHATIKTTDFKQDEIGVTVRFAGGDESLSPNSHPPVYEANLAGVFEGGLGKLDASDLRDTLTGKTVGVSFDIGEDAAVLSGATTKTDFAIQMQLLMAFATDAGYRADAYDRLKSQLPNYYTELNASPDGVFQMKASGLLHGGDPRFAMPSLDEFQASTNDQVKALIDSQLKTGPVEVTIVGDISEADAEAEIGKTFATLATRETAPVIPADALDIHFPTADLHQVFEHQGRADQNLSLIAWPGTDFTSDTQRARALTVLSEVLSNRLTDVVREKLGIAYSPYAGNTYSQVFPGYGYLSAVGEVKPENDQAFYDAVSGIVADLKANPISDDELLRAQKPLLDKMDTDLKTNSYWEGALPGSTTDPRKLDYIRTRRDQYKAVTAADIQRLANQYLDMSKALRIQIKPSAAATTAAPATSATPSGQ